MADNNAVRVPRQRTATTRGNYASLYVDAATGRVTVKHPGGAPVDIEKPSALRGKPVKCQGNLQVTGQVGVGVASPNAAAAVEVVSTTQGVLLPRMTTTQRNAISTPPDGLALYNSTDAEAQFRADSAWVAVGSGSGGGASLANDGDNRVTTGTGSGGINGEANLTFDGSTLSVTGGLCWRAPRRSQRPKPARTPQRSATTSLGATAAAERSRSRYRTTPRAGRSMW